MRLTVKEEAKMTNWLCDLAGFRNSNGCFRAFRFENILKLQCYLLLFGIQSAFNESSVERQQLLSSVLSKVYQNPYFYNLNPSPLNPAFNRFTTGNSPTTAFGTLHGSKPIFSVQLRPEPEPSLTPSRFFGADPLPNPLGGLLYNHHQENKPANEFSHKLPTNPHEPNRRNPLFANRVGSVGENRLPNDLLDQRLNAFHEQNRHTMVGHWCNKQMLQTLQPYCFCGRNRLTKNTIICSNVPDEITLRRSLHAAAVLLNLEGVYRISKLRIFNSTVDRLNLQTLPTTLSFMLVQLNKVGLRAFDQLSVLQTSMQQLRKLDLSNNELEEFPFSELFQLSGLLILKLAYNHLKTLPDDAFKGCDRLKMLDLSFNQLNYLGNHAFSGALNLKYLNLRYNQLKVLNNFALAFQPSSVILFINLSNNQMKLIADGAFDSLAVHRLYLNNNRLRKFPQSLFEPILSNMAKINIEHKIFYGQTEPNHHEAGGLGEFSDVTFRNAVVDQGLKLNKSALDVSSEKGDSLSKQLNFTGGKETNSNSLSDDNPLGISHNPEFRSHSIRVYGKYLRFLSSSGSSSNGSSSHASLTKVSSTNHPIGEQSRNESSPKSNSRQNFSSDRSSIIKDLNEELNILSRLDLESADLLKQLVYDSILKNLNLIERKRRPKSDRNTIDSLSDDELDASFYPQLFDWQAETQADEQALADHKASLNLAKTQNGNMAEQLLDSSNSFREEIKVSNSSTVFFDDEPNQHFDFAARPSTHLNFDQGDQSAAFIDLLDNDFQCNCKEFEWLFKLKKEQIQSLKEFHCANLPGQKKFLNLEQLTLSDINCWASY